MTLLKNFNSTVTMDLKLLVYLQIKDNINREWLLEFIFNRDCVNCINLIILILTHLWDNFQKSGVDLAIVSLGELILLNYCYSHLSQYTIFIGNLQYYL